MRTEGVLVSARRTHVTTHYTVVPRGTDERWKDVDMERVADQTDVMIVGRLCCDTTPLFTVRFVIYLSD